jgi:4,5-DOPA dioxygenase extradiol
MTKRMPAVFIGHGSPMEALESDSFTETLAGFGRTLGRPRAIVAASAHWEAPAPLRVTASARPETIHDFGGFPDELHEFSYPAPGDPALARSIVDRLFSAGVPATIDSQRGLDHGVWAPLSRLFPAADVPVVQISLPHPSDPARLLKAGAALAPLREEGVLILGTGNVTHNLRLARFPVKEAPIDEWPARFDDWMWRHLRGNDAEMLVRYRSEAPDAHLAAPTTDHIDPLFFVLGAGDGEPAQAIFEGFHFGNLSMRSFAIGPVS